MNNLSPSQSGLKYRRRCSWKGTYNDSLQSDQPTNSEPASPIPTARLDPSGRAPISPAHTAKTAPSQALPPDREAASDRSDRRNGGPDPHAAGAESPRGAGPPAAGRARGGIGLKFKVQGGLLVVEAIKPGGPCDGAGIAIGDALRFVDGQPAPPFVAEGPEPGTGTGRPGAGWTPRGASRGDPWLQRFREAMARVTGPLGTDVALIFTSPPHDPRPDPAHAADPDRAITRGPAGGHGPCFEVRVPRTVPMAQLGKRSCPEEASLRSCADPQAPARVPRGPPLQEEAPAPERRDAKAAAAQGGGASDWGWCVPAGREDVGARPTRRFSLDVLLEAVRAASDQCCQVPRK